MAAAGSFRRKRENGVLGLLLVTPVTESQLISGRLRVLWTQFLPGFLFLSAVWIYCGSWLGNAAVAFTQSVFYCGAFLTVPIVGLFYSLARRGFMSAFVQTALAADSLRSPRALRLGHSKSPPG